MKGLKIRDLPDCIHSTIITMFIVYILVGTDVFIASFLTGLPWWTIVRVIEKCWQVFPLPQVLQGNFSFYLSQLLLFLSIYLAKHIDVNEPRGWLGLKGLKLFRLGFHFSGFLEQFGVWLKILKSDLLFFPFGIQLSFDGLLVDVQVGLVLFVFFIIDWSRNSMSLKGLQTLLFLFSFLFFYHLLYFQLSYRGFTFFW